MSVAYLYNEHTFRLLKSGLIVMGYYFLYRRNWDCTNLVWKTKKYYDCSKTTPTWKYLFMYFRENVNNRKPLYPNSILILSRSLAWGTPEQKLESYHSVKYTLWNNTKPINAYTCMCTFSNEWFNFCNFSCFRLSHARSKTTSTNIHESTEIGQQITYKRGQTFKAPSLSFNYKLFFLM